MTALAAARALAAADVRGVWRDPMLRWFTLLPLGLALLIRALMPPVFGVLTEWLGHDVSPYYDPLVGFALATLAPSATGMVVGFLLLDHLDDGTLPALAASPVGLTGYLAYRLLVPLPLALAMTLVCFPLAGLGHVPVTAVVLSAITAAPLAPITALFLGAFARNKVQGFALMKASGVVQWPPLVAFFVPLPWQLAFGLAPQYWAARVYWSALEGGASAWLWLAPALAWQGLLVALLARRFRRVAAR